MIWLNNIKLQQLS